MTKVVHKIEVFKTCITEVDKEYAKANSECPYIDEMNGLSFVDKEGRICVWFDGEPDLETVVHESVHLANMVIDRTGMVYSSKEDELLAYLIAYIFSKLKSTYSSDNITGD